MPLHPSSDLGRLTEPKEEGLVSKTKAETGNFQRANLLCAIFPFVLQLLGITDF